MRGAHLAHVALALGDDSRLLALCGVLGLPVAPAEEIPSDGVRAVMIEAGDTRLEVLTPTDPEGPVGRFLARRGPGIHHIALAVPDLSATLDRLQADGVRLIDAAPRRGAGDARVAFIHPEGTGGVLVELVEEGGTKPFEP